MPSPGPSNDSIYFIITSGAAPTNGTAAASVSTNESGRWGSAAALDLSPVHKEIVSTVELENY